MSKHRAPTYEEINKKFEKAFDFIKEATEKGLAPLLDEMQKWEISARLQAAAAPPCVPLHITWFVPDARKSGGAYAEISGRIKKLLPHEKLVIMQDDTRIPLEYIVSVHDAQL